MLEHLFYDVEYLTRFSLIYLYSLSEANCSVDTGLPCSQSLIQHHDDKNNDFREAAYRAFRIQ